MNKYLICTWFFIFLYSCNNKPNGIIQNLTSDSIKYWSVIEEHPIIRDRQGFVLYSNGEIVNWWDSHLDSIDRFITSSESWRLLNDTTLWIGIIDPKNEDNLEWGTQHKIEYLNEDILILNNLSMQSLVIFKKSKDQKTKAVNKPIDESSFSDL